MLLKTSGYKQFVFKAAVVISAGLSVYFFQAFGSNPLTSVIWAFIAVIVQAYQVICLREYQNILIRKLKKNTTIPLLKYLFITVFSLVASISFGTMDINKTIYLNSDKTAKIDIIDQRIAINMMQLTNRANDLIRMKQISDLQRETVANTEYGSYRKNKQISALIGKMDSNKKMILDEIKEDKLKKAELIKNNSTTQGAFEALGSALLVGERAIRLIFLLCLSIIIELMVYSTSDFDKRSKGAKKGKKEESDQMTFGDVMAS
jgi:hypothetical protein